LWVFSVPLENLQSSFQIQKWSLSSICFLAHYLLIGPSEQLAVSFNESARLTDGLWIPVVGPCLAWAAGCACLDINVSVSVSVGTRKLDTVSP